MLPLASTSSPTLRATQPPVQKNRDPFPAGKTLPGRDAYHSHLVPGQEWVGAISPLHIAPSLRVVTVLHFLLLFYTKTRKKCNSFKRQLTVSGKDLTYFLFFVVRPINHIRLIGPCMLPRRLIQDLWRIAFILRQAIVTLFVLDSEARPSTCGSIGSRHAGWGECGCIKAMPQQKPNHHQSVPALIIPVGLPIIQAKEKK
jgi:hypothetical protein